MAKREGHTYPAWVEIDGGALAANYQAIRKALKRSARSSGGPVPEVLAVVKADAYGHGMQRAAEASVAEGAAFLGVSEPSEGVRLRELGFQVPILVFENLIAGAIPAVVQYGLTPTICDRATAEVLNRSARRVNRTVDVHVKIDTGMGRLGLWHETAVDAVIGIAAMSHLRVQGLYTHFPVADTDRRFTLGQIRAVKTLVRRLGENGLEIPYVHAANSMGVAGYADPVFNLVRPGLMLYGLYPSLRVKKTITLKPVMSVKARIIFVKDVPAGRGISYGHTFIAPRRMRVATLPIGYNDGYMRILSNQASVLVGGRRCRVLGRVTMDQMMVDVSRVSRCRAGDEAVIIGRQGASEVSADELAGHAGTINYEIVCSLGNRLPRVYR